MLGGDMRSSQKMVVTDLDGTLLPSGGVFSDRNIEQLNRLGAASVVRTIATGRSLFSARRVLPLDMPIDYLVFSTGAGIYDWRSQELLWASAFTDAQARMVSDTMVALGLDFMLHEASPRNHHFAYYYHSDDNPDFERRLSRYMEFAQPFDKDLSFSASQAVAIVPTEGESMIETVRARLPGCSVIRATSPLDGQSTWIEVFPPDVSKAHAAQRIADWWEHDRAHSVAVGNDFNDLDMLKWGGRAYVVGNAPPELVGEFIAVAKDIDDGFAEAVALSGLLDSFAPAE
jgi:HAD superfamily hydrolase (TIGR01484 family)